MAKRFFSAKNVNDFFQANKAFLSLYVLCMYMQVRTTCIHKACLKHLDDGASFVGRSNSKSQSVVNNKSNFIYFRLITSVVKIGSGARWRRNLALFFLSETILDGQDMMLLKTL